MDEKTSLIVGFARILAVYNPEGDVNAFLTGAFAFLFFSMGVIILTWFWAKLAAYGVENVVVLSTLAGNGLLFTVFMSLCVAQAANETAGVIFGLTGVICLVFLCWLGAWHMNCHQRTVELNELPKI